MRLIINEIFELEEFDYEKLAKYIRCMFQAILGLDDASALQLVDQALQIAREGKEVSTFLPLYMGITLSIATLANSCDRLGISCRLQNWSGLLPQVLTTPSTTMPVARKSLVIAGHLKPWI